MYLTDVLAPMLLPAGTNVAILPFVLMVVETLGDAWAAGWRITARCAWGKREGMKTRRECHYTRELDLETLVWTRGPSFPLSAAMLSPPSIRVQELASQGD
jgi:hypothetical protein